MFIFGDAFSENGNNNNRNTTAKGNYTPYGIEYKQGNNPTGRFTNDRTEADFVGNKHSQFLIQHFFQPPISNIKRTCRIAAERQGLPDIPPYANIGVSDILKGVNYASAAAGIRPETGSQRVLFLHNSFLIYMSNKLFGGFVFQCRGKPLNYCYVRNAG